MHVLLLNPPGRHLYLREYFCGKISKASYLIHPVDLLWLSAQLSPRYRVTLLDAIAERLSVPQTLTRVTQNAPDAMVLLSSSVSEAEDLDFARAVRGRVRGPLVVLGDNFLKDPVAALAAHPEIDAVLAGFLVPTLADYLAGARDGALRDLWYRRGDQIVASPPGEGNGPFTIGLPRHDLLALRRYRYPFARRLPYGTLLTDYGCPFGCTFCLIGGLRYRVREMEEVFAEIAFLKSLGVRDLYIDDQTFMPSQTRLAAFCEGILRMRLRLGWCCYVRADLADRERLHLMKRAGCHTVIVGIESGSDPILDRYGKGMTTAQIREAIATARAVGLATVGTFLIGLPGETEETCRGTIRFALEVAPDFASFNTPIPRAYTPMREEVVARGWQAESGTILDQSGKTGAVHTPLLSRRQAFELRNLAERRFYLRPGYVLRRLLRVRTPTQAYLLARDGTALLANIARKTMRRDDGPANRSDGARSSCA